MTETQIRIIRALQDGIPISEAPYDEIAKLAGVSVEELLEQLRQWQCDGTIRRFGAIVRHHQAGYTANAMAVWDVPDDLIEKFAAAAASFKNISHCYQRPRFPGFPYNLYTMIHGRSKEECEATARSVAAQSGVSNYKMLYTAKEFKKTSPVYFYSRKEAGR